MEANLHAIKKLDLDKRIIDGWREGGCRQREDILDIPAHLGIGYWHILQLHRNTEWKEQPRLP